MPQLDEELARLLSHEGVEHLFLLGSDGLLVRHLGEPGRLDVEVVTAMVPGIASACRSLGSASHRGDFTTAVVEFGDGVAIITPLSSELVLALLLSRGVGFAPLLREVRQNRSRLAALL